MRRPLVPEPPRFWYDAPGRPVIVGLAPGPRTPRGSPAVSPPVGEPLRSTTARVLQEALGRPVPEVFATTNLLERAGDEESIARIRERSASLIEMLRGRQVVAIGRVVGRALTGTACEGWMRWAVLDPSGLSSRTDLGVVAVLPHPSGLNRWWNDARNRASARAFLREVALGLGPLGSRARARR